MATKLEQSFTVAHPRDRVWDYFGNVVEVTECMPGASVTDCPASGPIKFKLTVKVGPVSAAFAGDAELERDAQNYRGFIRGSGRDKRTNSHTKGEVEYQLFETEGAATRVDIKVDYSLAGSLAQLSRGSIVNELAARLTTEFAANLQSRLDAMVEETGADTEVGSRRTPDSGEAPAGELRAGSLLWSILWERIKRFLRAVLGRK